MDFIGEFVRAVVFDFGLCDLGITSDAFQVIIDQSPQARLFDLSDSDDDELQWLLFHGKTSGIHPKRFKIIVSAGVIMKDMDHDIAVINQYPRSLWHAFRT